MSGEKNLLIVVGEWLQERQQRQSVRVAESTATRRLSRWLPSPGSVVFTLCMIGLLLWAQTAGALPLPGYLNAPDAPSTGTIAYQGRLADANGNPLTNTVNMEFRLYNAATGGTPLWSELWTGSNAVQVSDGLFNVMLGSLEPIPQNIMTGNNSLWLGITAGTDDEMMPRVQLGSVPFAVQALTVPDRSIAGAKLADSFGATGAPLLNYVPRLVAGQPDLLVTSQVGWTDWDLSAIIGNTASAVVIYVRVADDVQGTYVGLRSSVDILQRVAMVGGLHGGQYKGYSQLTIIPGNASVVQYKVDDFGAAPVEAQLWVVGWYEPARQ